MFIVIRCIYVLNFNSGTFYFIISTLRNNYKYSEDNSNEKEAKKAISKKTRLERHVLHIFFNQNNICNVYSIKDGELIFTTIFKKNFVLGINQEQKLQSFFLFLIYKSFKVIISDHRKTSFLFLFWSLVAK